jgi:flagellar basal body-associated protein FliL
MFRFVSDNVLMILTILGAVLSFLASLIGLISKKKPILILGILAILGFTVGISYQVYSYNQKQEEERRKAAKEQIAEAAQRARDNVVNEINLTVKQTKITVESIAQQLNKATLNEVATELVTMRSSGNVTFEETAAFAKGSPDMWRNYARWLASLSRTTVAPSLSLTINTNHYYDSGLLLAYLLTSEATLSSLGPVVGRHDEWHSFPAEEIYLKTFSPQTAHLQYVLFYDVARQLPVAYAEAQEFTQELMVYHRLKQHAKIDALLNSRSPNAISELKKSFFSIQTAVFASKTPAELVKLMIDQQLAISVTTADKKTYVAKLVRMIQLAAKKD